MPRIAIVLLSFLAVLIGSDATAKADATTQLPFANGGAAWLAVDPSGGHVFVSGGTGTSSIVVLDFAGQIVKTIAGQSGASQMALDTATHTLYTALSDQNAISEIDTQTLTETARFSTAPYPDPSSLVIAGGRLWFSCYESDGHSCPGLVLADLNGSNMAAAGPPVASWSLATTTLTAGGPFDKYLAVADSYISPPDVDVYDVSGATPTLVSHIHDPGGFTHQVVDMTFDPSGSNLLLASPGAPFLESLATSTLLSSGDYPVSPVSVAITADGKFIAVGINPSLGPDVYIYRVGKTAFRKRWKFDDANLAGVAHGLAFSPDATKLFAVAPDSATGYLEFHVLDSPTVGGGLTATHTSMTRSAKSVRYGSHTRLTVRVTGTSSGTVELYETVGHAKTWINSHAVKSGKATFTVTPTQNTSYWAWLDQTADTAASKSRNVRISVSPIVTVATHVLRGPRIVHGRRAIRTNLTGTTRPLRPSTQCGCGDGELEQMGFVIQRRSSGTAWHTVVNLAPASIGASGVKHAWFWTNRGDWYRVRALYSGDAEYVRAHSAWRTFRVPQVH